MKPIKGATTQGTHRTSHMAHRTATASVIKFNLFKLRQWQICVFNCLHIVSQYPSLSVCVAGIHYSRLISCALQSVDISYTTYTRYV